MLSKAVDLTIFGIAISFLLLAILIFFIVIIKYFDKKLDNNENKKQDSNYDKVLAASVAVSLVESELEHYKSAYIWSNFGYIYRLGQNNRNI